MLVERLSHRGHLLVPIDRHRAGRYRQNVGPPINRVALRPIDRVWPSDLKVDEITVLVEEVMLVRPAPMLGTFLDIWR